MSRAAEDYEDYEDYAAPLPPFIRDILGQHVASMERDTHHDRLVALALRVHHVETCIPRLTLMLLPDAFQHMLTGTDSRSKRKESDDELILTSLNYLQEADRHRLAGDPVKCSEALDKAEAAVAAAEKSP